MNFPQRQIPNPEDVKLATGEFDIKRITSAIERLIDENALRMGSIRERMAKIRAELDNLNYHLACAKGSKNNWSDLMEIEAGLRRLNDLVPPTQGSKK